MYCDCRFWERKNCDWLYPRNRIIMMNSFFLHVSYKTDWKYHMIYNRLKIAHGIKQFEGITWNKTVWRYHMASNSLKVSHGIKQFEGTTLHNKVWMYHMV